MGGEWGRGGTFLSLALSTLSWSTSRPGDGQRLTPPHRPCLRRPSPGGTRASWRKAGLHTQQWWWGLERRASRPGRKPHAVKRPARPYKRDIQTDFLWIALKALNRPWAARTVPQCSCSGSKAARASAGSSQTQRSPTFGQPSRRLVIAAASHRGGRLRFLTQVPNRREPKRERAHERERAQERDSSIERERNRERDSPRERGLTCQESLRERAQDTRERELISRGACAKFSMPHQQGFSTPSHGLTDTVNHMTHMLSYGT